MPGDAPVTALVVAYDGGPFAGWQLQPDRPTVQGTIEAALSTIHGAPRESVALVGAGRTDAGVHALGQVATYRAPNRRELPELLHGLAGLLPDSVRVLAARRLPASFHACRSATGKHYRYRIVNRRIALPFETPWVWVVRPPLDLPAMREASDRLLGRHDFSAFASAGGQQETTVRTLRRLELTERPGGGLELDAEADGFLYRMVRNLAGFLVDVGLGRRTPSEVDGVLSARDRRRAGGTAPAQGLCLVRVDYGPEWDEAEGATLLF
ncbi:MAG: tRNA pseudouridine(38-40) synthase TruA [Acidobacteria bacterium]|nr:tRNA pseudouridine(38-40) synthase TruA [Acidobacteriota bacterium]